MKQLPKVKLLPLWQPFATLVALGEKKLETRGYQARWSGLVAIHACKTRKGKRYYQGIIRETLEKHNIASFEDLPFGRIVAVATLGEKYRTDQIVRSLSENERSFGDYRKGRFAWQLNGVIRVLPQIPYVGGQGMPYLQRDAVKQLQDAGYLWQSLMNSMRNTHILPLA